MNQPQQQPFGQQQPLGTPVKAGEVLGPEQSALIELIAIIQRADAEVYDSFKRGCGAAIKAGRALIEAKKQCGRGGWEDFVAGRLHYPMRKVQRYMALARWEIRLEKQRLEGKPTLVSSLSSLPQRQALKLLNGAKRRRRMVKKSDAGVAS